MPTDLIYDNNEQCLSTINPLLFFAARGGDLNAVIDLLDKKKADINSISYIHELQKRCTALYVASTHNHYPVVKSLLEHRADTEIPIYEGITLVVGATPIIIATYHGHLESLALLIKYGANKDIKFSGATALQIAMDRNHSEAIKLLTDGVDAFCNQIQGEEMITRFVGICEENINSPHTNDL